MQTVPLRIAVENEKPKRVAFFSLEMSRDQLVQRGDPSGEKAHAFRFAGVRFPGTGRGVKEKPRSC